MKIHFRSDVHFEVNKGLDYPAYPDVDVIILAGDIEDSEHAKELARSRPQTSVVVVLGNHDYWYLKSKNVETGHLEYSDPSVPNLHVLENSGCEIQGQRFYGACLWGQGSTEYGDNREMRRSLNDFHYIKHGWSPQKMHDRNINSRMLLVHELNTKRPIVVTHFPPMESVLDPQYKGEFLTKLYYSAGMDWELNNLMQLHKNPALWIFGHSHSTMDLKMGIPGSETRFMSNCRGYVHHERSSWNPNLVVEI